VRKIGLRVGVAAAALTGATFIGAPVWAASCASAPVSVYTVAGFSCSVGPVTFSNINVNSTGLVTLGNFTPFTLGGEFGLTLNYSSVASGVNQSSDVAWTYSVSGSPALSDAFAQLTGTVTGTGVANLSEQLLSTGGQTIGSLVLNGPNTSDTITFAAIQSLFVLKDQQNFSGTNGSAFTSLMTNAFSVVPLPGALPLFATGLGALGLLGWRRKRKAQSSLI
jgi:hypothetical protein